MVKVSNQQKKRFNYMPEDGQNPYTGIVSFQHFRNEPLYSDIVVKPENHMCETESVEVYPIDESVPQNGRAEGYYPDSTIAYIRILWKDFEPQRGNYNYNLMEEILDKARNASQTVMFRLLPHSTCARDDVPDWLKKLIPCPERPKWKRVKASPTDPLFVELFLEAIRKLGERFDADPVLAFVDISMPGCWGEGYNADAFSFDTLKTIYDTYIEVFPNTKLISQLGYPEPLRYGNEKAHIGQRCDGLGSPGLTNDYIPTYMNECPDFWKNGHVSFESFWWLCEWKRQGWNIDDIIEKTLEWHISSFNPKSLPIPYEWEDKIKYWISKMGYHFTIDTFSTPESASAGDDVELTLEGENIGVAPTYHSTPLKVNFCGEKEFSYETNVDITTWMPGKFKEKFIFTLPDDMPFGEYDVKISIYDDVARIVYFATDAPFDGKRYTVGHIKIC